MDVIVNSDVLFTNGFSDKKLHKQWHSFALGCKGVGAKLVFPSTALFEVELRQEELHRIELGRIKEATKLLKKYCGAIEFPSEDQLISVPDVVALFKKTGLNVRIEAATIEDFRVAERRAAKHLPPALPRRLKGDNTPEDQSDEMRDLVIWALACRLAKSNGGALLLSRDKVHSGVSGGDEAETCGLLRATEFDDAIGMLGAETPAGNVAKKFLQLAWENLISAGLPVVKPFAINSVTHPVFVQGELDLSRATFQFSCSTSNSQTLSSQVQVTQKEPDVFTLSLTNTKIGKSAMDSLNFSVNVSSVAELQVDDHQERLSALKQLLEQ